MLRLLQREHRRVIPRGVRGLGVQIVQAVSRLRPGAVPSLGPIENRMRWVRAAAVKRSPVFLVFPGCTGITGMRTRRQALIPHLSSQCGKYGSPQPPLSDVPCWDWVAPGAQG